VRLFVDPADAGFRLLANVNLLISERHDHVIGESELRNSLANLVNNIVVSEAVDNPIPRLKISFSSESQWQTVDRVYALAA